MLPFQGLLTKIFGNKDGNETITVDEPYNEDTESNASDDEYLAVDVLQLRKILAPDPSRAHRYIDHLNDTMKRYEIDTRLRQAHFLAQICHESGRLRYKREIWGPTSQQEKYEPVTELSQKLGNTEPGDGYRFRGRGLIQLTGRYNYTQYAERLSEILGYPVTAEETAERLDEDRYATDVAGWYWHRRDLNEWADADNVREVTRRINGGYNGLQDRIAFLNKAKQVFEI